MTVPLPFPNPTPEIEAAIAKLEAGFRPLYRAGTDCPACWGKAWFVGRYSAQCGNERCGCVLPLAHDEQRHAA